MEIYQEYATKAYNKNKKVLKPIDLKEVVSVKYVEVIKNFDTAIGNLQQLIKLNKELSTGSKKTINTKRIGRNEEEFSIVKDCPLNVPYYAFAIKSLFFCCDDLKAFEYWICYATKIEIFDAIRYAVDEGFYTDKKISTIIYKILKKHI